MVRMKVREDVETCKPALVAFVRPFASAKGTSTSFVQTPGTYLSTSLCFIVLASATSRHLAAHDPESKPIL